VDVVMPQGTDIFSLIPAITVSTGATIDPLSGVANGFTSVTTYMVTAEDGVTEKPGRSMLLFKPMWLKISATF